MALSEPLPPRETGALALISRLLAVGLFFLLALVLAQGPGGIGAMLFAGTLAAAFLALSIGANDGANSIAMAVGSRTLPLVAAMSLAIAGELAGAFLASDPVSHRLQEGLLDLTRVHPETGLAAVLLAGMLAGALWLSFATAVAVPISTTHSVVGGLLGAAAAAHGWSAVRWDELGRLTLVWLGSPLLAALGGGATLYLVKRAVTYQPNLVGAARTRVPLLSALLALVFSDYFFVDLAPDHWHLSENHLLTSLVVALVVFLVAQPLVGRMAQQVKNTKQGVNRLFGLPLMLAVAFFSFAHGANDVANVAAPLTALAAVTSGSAGVGELLLPTWTLAVGGLGIALGIGAFGGGLVRTMGTEITEIDKLRAFSVVLSSALVILLASHFGLPVSTTHTLVGSIVGVGLLRELMKRREQRTLEKIRKCHEGEDRAALEPFLRHFGAATLPRKRALLEALYRERGDVPLRGEDLRRIDDLYRTQLVERVLIRRILLFWILTLPVAGLLGGLLHGLLARVWS